MEKICDKKENADYVIKFLRKETEKRYNTLIKTIYIEEEIKDHERTMKYS